MSDRTPLPSPVTQPFAGEAPPAPPQEGRQKLSERRQRYDQSPKGQARDQRYAQSEKGKAANERYRKSEKGKKAYTEASKRWNRKHKQQATQITPG